MLTSTFPCGDIWSCVIVYRSCKSFWHNYPINLFNILYYSLKMFLDAPNARLNIDDCPDVHAVAGLLKLYLRELPEPLLTAMLYDAFTSNACKYFILCVESSLAQVSINLLKNLCSMRLYAHSGKQLLYSFTV